MKKLSVEEEVKRGLITAKYQYPAYRTTYDREGNITSNRVVTHNITATQKLRKLYPELKKEIDRITLESAKKPRKESTNTSKLFPDKDVWRMMNRLGKNRMITVPKLSKTSKQKETKIDLDAMGEEFLKDVG